MLMKMILSICLCGIFSLAAMGSAFGSIMEATASSALQTGFDGNILNNDVIENGSSALSGAPTTTGSVSGYAGGVAPGNSFANLTDGLASTKVNSDDISHDTYFDGGSFSNGNPTITYSFSNPLGETLTSINSISGWADTQSFSHQDYSVAVSLVGAPAVFIPLASVNYDPWNGGNGGAANSSQVTVTDSTGVLATGVAAIQFTILNNGGSGQVFREFDVVGQPTPAPEPSSLVLLGLGAAGLFVAARRCRKLS
jgi:PEP-CTERM motif